MNKIKTLTIALFFLFAFQNISHAQEEKPLKLKSMTTAVLLGIDPIPGDALFYAGHPIQGTINLIIGGAGAALFYTGLIRSISFNNRCEGQPNHEGSDCDGFINMGNAIAILGGAMIYFPSLLWDGVVGPLLVQSHNKKVQKQNQISLRPNFSIDPSNGFQAGLTLTF